MELLLGGLAGWLAGKFMRGDGYGIIVDVILGLIGAWVGSWIFARLGLSVGGEVGYFLAAFVGAVLLVWISRLIKRG